MFDDARDVRTLEAVTAEHGFEFAQVSYLEELPLSVQYTGEAWVPSAHGVSASGFSPLLKIAVNRVRTLGRRFVDWVHSRSMKQVIVGVILFKKVFLIALFVWLVV